MLELDNTSRVCFDSCERKYYLRHVLDLVPLEPQSMAPYFGIAIHKGVEAFYLGKSRDECLRAFAEEYAKWFDEKDDERSPGNGIIILDEYFKRWREDYIKTLKLEIGHSVVISEGELEVVYKMRIDRIGEWDSEICLVDWKTSKYVGSQFTIVKPNNQFVGYALGVKELMGVNPTFFLDLIGTKVRKKVEVGGERVELVRDNVKFNEEDFEEFKKGVLKTARRILESEREGYWAKRTHSCPSFHGCEYLPLCKSNEETFESMAATFYKKDKWKSWEE